MRTWQSCGQIHKTLTEGKILHSYTINFWECEGHMVGRIKHYLSLDLLRLAQLMPSHKRTSIMDKASGLISSRFNAASSQDMPFHQPQFFKLLYHDFIKAYICAVFLSALPRWWRFLVCYGFSAKLVRRTSRGTSYAIHCLECYKKCWKWCVVIHHDWEKYLQFWLVVWGISHWWNIPFFYNDLIDFRDSFLSYTLFKHCVMGLKSVNTKHTG